MSAGPLDRRVTIEALSVVRDADTGAEQRSWADVATVWAHVRESSTSNAGLSGDAVAAYARPTKVRIRWRDLSRETHRLSIGDRVLRIIGTAQIGRRVWLEMACEEWSNDD